MKRITNGYTDNSCNTKSTVLLNDMIVVAKDVALKLY